MTAASIVDYGVSVRPGPIKMSHNTAVRFSKRAASQRNAEILDSSLACFNEQGCFQTTVDQVVADVGIGKGTLYRHYASREDLFKDALRQGLDTFRARCQRVWETHENDPDEGVRAVIHELVSLNRSGEPVSPATLARLDCGSQWITRSKLDNGNLEAVLLPLIRSWQAVRLFDEAADPSLIAAVIVALVNSPAIFNYSGGEPAEEPEARRSLRSSGQTSDIADRLVKLLRRAFPPVGGSESTVEEP